MMRSCILALALLLVVSGARADESGTNHITVYGTATLQVVPNQMKWRLNVRNTNPKSTSAAEEHGVMVASVMEFLKQSQIPEETIQTSGMRLGVNWRVVGGSSTRDGYFASTDVSFTLADFAKYPSVWIGLSALPGLTVWGVEMDHTDRIRFQNEARVQAVQAALKPIVEKKQAIAAIGRDLAARRAEVDRIATDQQPALVSLVALNQPDPSARPVSGQVTTFGRAQG